MFTDNCGLFCGRECDGCENGGYTVFGTGELSETMSDGFSHSFFVSAGKTYKNGDRIILTPKSGEDIRISETELLIPGIVSVSYVFNGICKNNVSGFEILPVVSGGESDAGKSVGFRGADGTVYLPHTGFVPNAGDKMSFALRFADGAIIENASFELLVKNI